MLNFENNRPPENTKWVRFQDLNVGDIFFFFHCLYVRIPATKNNDIPVNAIRILDGLECKPDFSGRHCFFEGNTSVGLIKTIIHIKDREEGEI